MEKISMIIIGLFIIALGIVNIFGNVSTIHWYNRTKVTEQDIPKYGKVVGTGTTIVGASILIMGILRIFLDSVYADYIVLLGAVVGVGFILYAQFKYNKGLF